MKTTRRFGAVLGAILLLFSTSAFVASDPASAAVRTVRHCHWSHGHRHCHSHRPYYRSYRYSYRPYYRSYYYRDPYCYYHRCYYPTRLPTTSNSLYKL